MNRRAFVALAVSAAFAAGALTALLGQRIIGEPAGVPDSRSAAAPERKVLYWHDPMVPGTRFDKPGKSPFMDMELVPVYDDEQGRSGVAGAPSGEANTARGMPGATGEAPSTEGAPVVTVRPEIINSLGVRTYRVEPTRLARRAITHGYLMPAEDRGAFSAQVDIFDRDADWVQVGMPARLTLTTIPGKTFSGRITHIDPDIGIGARSLKAQVRIMERDTRLKTNLFAEVTVESPSPTAQLAVPREALIRTGERTAVVRALGKGRFQPVEVSVGRELGEFLEIREGLKAGDQVVTSGQFLIDSEANLRASFTRLSSPEPPAAEGKATSPPPQPEHRH